MNEQEQQIRIAIVDDHEMFRAGVIATLQPHFDIVGQASDVEGSVAMIAQTKPNVVLLDVHVPGGEGGGGAEILMKSRAYSPNTVFLALSVSDSPQDVGSVIRAGAQGYVTKTISGDDLISSIKQVYEGYAVFSPKLAGFVLSAFQNGSPAGIGSSASGPIHDDELDRLSNREQEVMRLIARGYTYKEVAAELFISIKTVETHVSSVLRKLQLSNRTELTALFHPIQRKLQRKSQRSIPPVAGRIRTFISLPATQIFHPLEKSGCSQTPQREKSPSHWKKMDAYQLPNGKNPPVTGRITPPQTIPATQILHPLEESGRSQGQQREDCSSGWKN